MAGRLDRVADAELRSRLEAAHAHLRRREPTEAVHALSEVFLDVLRAHPELLERWVPLPRGQTALLVTRWPALGANLDMASVKEGRPRMELVREHFAMSEAITYYEFMLDTAIAEEL
jgi:hypothetical protein